MMKSSHKLYLHTFARADGVMSTLTLKCIYGKSQMFYNLHAPCNKNNCPPQKQNNAANDIYVPQTEQLPYSVDKQDYLNSSKMASQLENNA